MEISIPSKQDTNLRHNASYQLDETIEQIRRIPGFDRFLQPLRAEELMNAAAQGPIVIINANELCSDALLVGTDYIRWVNLYKLWQRDIIKNVKLMRSIWSDNASHHQMSGILEWLWDVIARPILDQLGFVGPPSDDNWPRVWWISTGPLSLLPLHAAGRHFPTSTETVLDRVVSSYSPSVKALLHALQDSRRNDLDSTTNRALTVSMDETPGRSGLGFVKEEVERLTDIFFRTLSQLWCWNGRSEILYYRP